MSLESIRKQVGRKRATVVELVCDYCTHTYGVAPCTAAVGVTGPQKCFNTRKTCQDSNNYLPAPKSYVFSDQVMTPAGVGGKGVGQLTVAGGAGGDSVVSVDGDTFTLYAPPVSLHFMSAGVSTFGPDENITKSNTAAAWVNLTSPLGATAQCLAMNFCNGLWMVGNLQGNGLGDDAARSPDGTSWTAMAIPFATGSSYQGFLYALGLYFAWGANPATYCTSIDAAAWTSRTPPMAANFRWMETDGSQVVCAGEASANNTSFYYSSDGVTWTVGTQAVARVTFGIRKIVHAVGLFVAVGYAGSTNEGVIYTSTDGHFWTYRANPWNTIDGLCSVAYGNGVWVTTAPHTGTMTSPDGVTWTTHAGPSEALNDVAFYAHDGLFYAGGDSGGQYASADGITWSGRTDMARGVSTTYRIAVRP